MEIKTVSEITVDVSNINTYSTIVAKQGDSDSRFIHATITNSGKKIILDVTSEININFKRCDGEAKSYLGEVYEDGTVMLPLPYWALELSSRSSRLQCDISIIEQNSRKLTSATFFVQVEPTCVSSDDVQSSESYDIFLKLLDAAENEDDRIIAETQRLSNEASRISNENVRISVETQRANAENTRASSETTRIAVEIAATTAAKNATTAANNAAQQVASALLAGGMIPIHDEDSDVNYSFQLIVRNGYPVLVMTEATTNSKN